MSSGSSYCSATMLPAASLATPQKRLAHSHLQVHLLDRAWFVDCVGHPAHRMLVLCMIDVCSQCCKNPIRTRIVIADHYSCSLHSKIADDELQTARRNARFRERWLALHSWPDSKLMAALDSYDLPATSCPQGQQLALPQRVSGCREGPPLSVQAICC